MTAILMGFVPVLVVLGFVALWRRAEMSHAAFAARVDKFAAALPVLTLQIDALRKKQERDLNRAAATLGQKIDALREPPELALCRHEDLPAPSGWAKEPGEAARGEALDLGLAADEEADTHVYTRDTMTSITPPARPS